MGGLDQGLASNTSAPLTRIADLSSQMTRALAVGAGGVAMVTATPAAAQGPGSAGGAGVAPVHNHYTIQVSVSGGAAAQDIADQVREALEKIERDRRGRVFGDD